MTTATIFLRSALSALVVCAAAASAAGDFANPAPLNLDSSRARLQSSESQRLATEASGAGDMFYTLGDYFERYQSGTNWNNAVQSGNTIILNGDNNSVTLSTDGSTFNQTSQGNCQTSTNTFLNAGGTATTPTTCGAAE